jgi:hypothetical protein
VLVKRKWIAEEEGKYRLFSQIERTFEEELGRQRVSDMEKQELTYQTAKKVLSGLNRYNYHGRTFDIRILIDGREITSAGYIAINLFSSRSAVNKGQIDVITAKSVATRDTIYWILATEETFEKKIEHAIRLKKALKEKEHNESSVDEQRTIDKHTRELEILVHDYLPELFSKVMSSGMTIYQDRESKNNGTKNLQPIYNEKIKEVIEEIFTEFSHAECRLDKDDDIAKILTWNGGKLPKIYTELQLIDESGNILVDRPVASKILAEVKRRVNEDIESQTGASLTEHFEKPPYGWDPKILRLVVATLFKNGSIIMSVEGREIILTDERRSSEVFLNSRIFNKTGFLLGQELSRELKDEASNLISGLFGGPGGNTAEEINKALERVFENKKTDCDRLKAITEFKKLPIREGISDLQHSINEILGTTNANRRILTFLEHRGIFEANMPILDKLIKFENEQNLHKYYLINDFLQFRVQMFSSLLDQNIQSVIKTIRDKSGIARIYG